MSNSLSAPSYSFDNDDPQATDRHAYLSAMLDESTFARLAHLGDLTGRRCLELGAGGGSVARWLADQVGASGQVLATDLNPRHLAAYPGYTVLAHDLTTDPIPEGPWDVIHARLVLMHLPERRDILARLTAALAPGGALVIEDWLTSFGKPVLTAPDPEAEALVDAFHTVLVDQVLAANGTDPRWAGQIHAAMLAAGLIHVDTVIGSRSWPGGSPGALLLAANIGQVRDKLLAAGLTAAQLERLKHLVADVRLVLRGHLLYSTVGRLPGAW
jgi:SAM-dependent methyltransferase